MSLKLNFKKIIIIYLVSILLINSIMYLVFFQGIKPFSDSKEKMILIKIKPIKYAMIFAHGNYGTFCYPSRKNCSYITNKHYTFLNNSKGIPTINLLNDLKEEGFERVWLSQCGTGDYPYMTFNSSSGERIDWYPWVSRNERPGNTYPIFLGFGFVRLTF